MKAEACFAPHVILITEPSVTLERLSFVIESAARALGPHRLAVQLRDKASSPDVVRPRAEALRRVTRAARALFIVNGAGDDVLMSQRLELARGVGADGIHVSCNPEAIARARRELSHGWITVPGHTGDDVALAERGEVHGVLISPIFDTPGKGQARGLAPLARAARTNGALRGYALGGVEPTRAAACAEAGADGVAVIRALLDAVDPFDVARLLGAPFSE